MKIIIINCFDTYQHRANMLRTCFSAGGWEVIELRSDFSHRTKQPVEQSGENVIYLHAHPYQKNLSIDRLRSHQAFGDACQNWLEQLNETPDLLWVMLPPNSLAKACAQYKKNHPTIKLIFDLIDLWPETFPAGSIKWLPPFYLWRRLRDKYLPYADHIVTECRLYESRLDLDCTRTTTLYMCRQDEYQESAPAPEDGKVSLCYLGSINHIIDIDAIAALICALRVQRPVRLHVVGGGENLEKLLSAAEQAGAEVFNHGMIFDSTEKQKIFDQCDFGLNVMKPTVCVGLTMKSVDYLAGGLPLLNTIPGDTWDLVERYGIGINWTPANTIDLSAYDRIKTGRQARAFYAAELTYDRFAQRVNEITASVIL